MVRKNIDLDNLLKLYQSGESVKHLAEILGVGRPLIVRRLKNTRKRTRLHFAKIRVIKKHIICVIKYVITCFRW